MEQLSDLQLFIKANKLKQKQVADYLGTSTQYVNQVVNGKCSLSDDKYELLAKSDWDVTMINFPPYIQVKPSTITIYETSENSEDNTSISVVPAEVVEEIKEEIRAEIEEAESVPLVSSKVANDITINVRKFVEKRGDEMERIKPNDLVGDADIAERIRKGSMMPTFMPGDIVFVRFIDDKKIISDGHTYYFDLKGRPTIIRKVKIEGSQLRLIAENPTFGDIITNFDEVENVADIVGMFRSFFSNQYAEIEEVRRRKDEQIDNLVEQNGELIEQNGEALKIIRELLKKQ